MATSLALNTSIATNVATPLLVVPQPFGAQSYVQIYNPNDVVCTQALDLAMSPQPLQSMAVSPTSSSDSGVLDLSKSSRLDKDGDSEGCTSPDVINLVMDSDEQKGDLNGDLASLAKKMRQKSE